MKSKMESGQLNSKTEINPQEKNRMQEGSGRKINTDGRKVIRKKTNLKE